MTFVPLVGVPFGILGATFGTAWFVLLLIVGSLLGLFLSQIVAAGIETIALILVYVNRDDELPE